jgi:hypothetical protein
MPATGPGSVISAARFVISFDGEEVTFAELVGVSSESASTARR